MTIVLGNSVVFSELQCVSMAQQEVEYVKQEAKIVYLLECLQKTSPPVLIFAEKKQDVDAIHEYLLLKGVEAVAIHGGKGCILVLYMNWRLEFIQAFSNFVKPHQLIKFKYFNLKY